MDMHVTVVHTSDMKVLLNVKVDKEAKEEGQALAEELGLTLSAVMNALLLQFVRERTLEVRAQHRLKPEVEGHVGKIIEDMKAGRNVSPTFDNHEDMVEYFKQIRRGK